MSSNGSNSVTASSISSSHSSQPNNPRVTFAKGIIKVKVGGKKYRIKVLENTVKQVDNLSRNITQLVGAEQIREQGETAMQILMGKVCAYLQHQTIFLPDQPISVDVNKTGISRIRSLNGRTTDDTARVQKLSQDIARNVAYDVVTDTSFELAAKSYFRGDPAQNPYFSHRQRTPARGNSGAAAISDQLSQVQNKTVTEHNVRQKCSRTLQVINGKIKTTQPSNLSSFQKNIIKTIFDVMQQEQVRGGLRTDIEEILKKDYGTLTKTEKTTLLEYRAEQYTKNGREVGEDFFCVASQVYHTDFFFITSNKETGSSEGTPSISLGISKGMQIRSEQEARKALNTNPFNPFLIYEDPKARENTPAFRPLHKRNGNILTAFLSKGYLEGLRKAHSDPHHSGLSSLTHIAFRPLSDKIGPDSPKRPSVVPKLPSNSTSYVPGSLSFTSTGSSSSTNTSTSSDLTSTRPGNSSQPSLSTTPVHTITIPASPTSTPLAISTHSNSGSSFSSVSSSSLSDPVNHNLVPVITISPFPTSSSSASSSEPISSITSHSSLLSNSRSSAPEQAPTPSLLSNPLTLPQTSDLTLRSDEDGLISLTGSSLSSHSSSTFTTSQPSSNSIIGPLLSPSVLNADLRRSNLNSDSELSPFTNSSSSGSSSPSSGSSSSLSDSAAPNSVPLNITTSPLTTSSSSSGSYSPSILNSIINSPLTPRIPTSPHLSDDGLDKLIPSNNNELVSITNSSSSLSSEFLPGYILSLFSDDTDFSNISGSHEPENDNGHLPTAVDVNHTGLSILTNSTGSLPNSLRSASSPGTGFKTAEEEEFGSPKGFHAPKSGKGASMEMGRSLSPSEIIPIVISPIASSSEPISSITSHSHSSLSNSRPTSEQAPTSSLLSNPLTLPPTSNPTLRSDEDGLTSLTRSSLHDDTGPDPKNTQINVQKNALPSRTRTSSSSTSSSSSALNSSHSPLRRSLRPLLLSNEMILPNQIADSRGSNFVSAIANFSPPNTPPASPISAKSVPLSPKSVDSNENSAAEQQALIVQNKMELDHFLETFEMARKFEVDYMKTELEMTKSTLAAMRELESSNAEQIAELGYLKLRSKMPANLANSMAEAAMSAMFQMPSSSSSSSTSGAGSSSSSRSSSTDSNLQKDPPVANGNGLQAVPQPLKTSSNGLPSEKSQIKQLPKITSTNSKPNRLPLRSSSPTSTRSTKRTSSTLSEYNPVYTGYLRKHSGRPPSPSDASQVKKLKYIPSIPHSTIPTSASQGKITKKKKHPYLKKKTPPLQSNLGDGSCRTPVQKGEATHKKVPKFQSIKVQSNLKVDTESGKALVQNVKNENGVSFVVEPGSSPTPTTPTPLTPTSPTPLTPTS